MSDLFGSHIVGFPTRRLIYDKVQVRKHRVDIRILYILKMGEMFISSGCHHQTFNMKSLSICILKRPMNICIPEPMPI